MVALLRPVLLMLSILLAATAPALAENKLAFVVGIDAYPHLKPEAQLERAVADAKAVSQALTELGFAVTPVTENATLETLVKRFTQFTKAIRPGDTVLLYYAGHGVSLEDGTYLIPADVAPLHPGDEGWLKRTALSEAELSRGIRIAGARIAILVFDACRNNPFTVEDGRALGDAGRGLKRLEPSQGMFTLYSAGEGQTALDRLGKGDTDKNSVFTRIFVKALRTPGLNISALGDRVRDEVADLAQSDGQDQTPAFYNQLRGAQSVFLAGPPPVGPVPVVVPPAPSAPPVPPPPPAADADGQAFAVAMLRDDIASLDAFLTLYPTSRFADRVRQERQRLAAVTPVAPPAEVATLQPAPAPIVRPCHGATLASLRERGAKLLTDDEACALQPKDEFKECQNCPTMVVVPSGSFTMGSPASEPGRFDDEGPQHRVSFAEPFAVGKFAVTFAEWDACVADGGCGGYRPGDEGWGRGLRPVINVTWNDAQSYVQWLAGKTQKPYRLLSEAEWEYVARAGSTTAFWWGNSISTDQANYDGTTSYNGGPKGAYRQKTLPVDSFKPNPWGLYNMLGNVWQWTQDCYQDSYAGAPVDGTASTTNTCKYRVLRGGSWYNNPRDLRAAYRVRNFPVNRYNIDGFRVALALPRTP